MGFDLKLLTPRGIAFEGNVDQVTAANSLGEFGVLADHVNFITAIVRGVVSVRTSSGEESHFAVAEGIARVKDGEMIILSPEARRIETDSRQDALKKLAAEIAGEVKSPQGVDLSERQESGPHA